jgi:PAS domain-containing protein
MVSRGGSRGGEIPAGQVTFSISEVAEMVGVSAHAIRAWERRYKTVKPIRTKSNQRRYTPEDVEGLVRMKSAAGVQGLSLRLAALEQETGHLANVLALSPASEVAGAHGYEPDAWRAVADLLRRLVFVIDSRGRVVDVNVAVARAADLLRSRLRGLSFADMVDPYDRAKAVMAYRSVARQRQGWDLNLRMGRLSGLYSFDCWSVTSKGQRLTILVGRDLSETLGDLWSRPSLVPDR